MTITKFIVALMLLRFSGSCFAQVYSTDIYSGGRTYEHQWHIGAAPHRFGFTQYREYQDANGMVLLTSEQHRAVRRSVYTQLDLATVHFRLPMPAWSVGVIILISLVAVGLLFHARRKIRTPRDENIHA